MHPYDETVERIKLENDTREAREWLEHAGSDYGVVHELSHDDSIEAVEEAYRRGAISVDVLGTIPEGPEKSSVDMLLITLPQDPQCRTLLFELEETIAGMTGYERSVDEGQHFILLRWT